jgi:hypothetical protein
MSGVGTHVEGGEPVITVEVPKNTQETSANKQVKTVSFSLCNVGFFMGKGELGQVPLRTLSFAPNNFHFTDTPYTSIYGIYKKNFTKRVRK